MRHLFINFFVLTFMTAAFPQELGGTHFDFVKLKNGSIFMGSIVYKDTVDISMRIHDTIISFKISQIDTAIENFPDPAQFTFKNTPPEKSRKWYIPIFWLRKQIDMHELRNMYLYEIAVDLNSGKLYLHGFGPEQFEETAGARQMKLRSDDYYEKIPPDGD